MTRPIRRILVAIKVLHGSNGPTLRKAAMLARALGAKLELFHAMTEPVAVDALRFAGQNLKQFEIQAGLKCLQRLETLAAPLRRTGLAVTSVAERDYPVHEALLRRAHRSKADLIIAQRHAGRHVAPFFLRYTDWELLRQSPVPVLLVKTARPYATLRMLAAVDPTHALASTSRLDEEILGRGAHLARASGGQLHAVHAYVPTLMDMTPQELSAPDATARINAHAASHAETAFDKATRAARLGKLRPSHRHLVVGHAVDVIPAIARKLRCDIVVMGAVSRSGLERLIIGNTAERLLDDLPCDLLVVKPRNFTTRIAGRPRGPLRMVLGPPAGVV